MTALEYHPNFEKVAERWEAWWNREDIGRAAVWATAWDPDPKDVGPATKEYATVRDRWLDLEHRVAQTDFWLRNTYYTAEAYPTTYPELGPEVFVGFMGAELQFTEGSSWAVPLIEDWDAMPEIAFNRQSPIWLAMEELTERLLEVGKGKFIVGHMDIHSGGDAAAALRDPEQLCLDLALDPERVHALMAKLRPLYAEVYDHFHGLMLAAGQTGTTGWIPAYCEGKYTPVQIDFICMISEAMFGEFFLDALVEECDFLDRSIYHLDGPDALRHLDAILGIESLDAVQWVPGANTGPLYQWMPYLHRIQEAGKNLVICDSYFADDWEADMLRTVGELDPCGVFIQLRALPTRAEADEFVMKLERL